MNLVGLTNTRTERDDLPPLNNNDDEREQAMQGRVRHPRETMRDEGELRAREQRL